MTLVNEDTWNISDLHKDAMGFRPRGEDFWNWWDNLPDAGKREYCDELCAMIDSQAAREAEEEAQAQADFEARIMGHIQLGAKDRTTAIRWIVQAEGYTEYDSADYITWDLGLGYRTKYDDEIRQARKA